MRFRDRSEAGVRLAELLSQYRGAQPLVLALPRGGVAVGFEVARSLGAPLDVIVARKLGAPGHEELGIGAIAPGGVLVLDAATIDALGISQAQIDRVVARETQEMERRTRLYRDHWPDPVLAGRTVIVVDDGLATGVTARAAVESARRRAADHIVLAVPVCASETAAALRPLVDDFVCVLRPETFMAVGLWYERFEQMTDEEVMELLEASRRNSQTTGAAAR